MKITDAMGPPIGKYKGVVNFHGILIGLEHVSGNVNPHSGKRVAVSYGDIPGSQGVDGDPVDVLLGDDWSSQTIYVLQDAHVTDKDAPGEPDQYGEDKFAIGFRSEAEARAAHASYYSGDARKIVGCIVSNVEEVRERIQCPYEAGLPWFAKSVVSDLVKSVKPPKGFTPIPKTKHAGFRKRDGKGGWHYWYPDQHHHEHHDDWEADYGSGFGTKDAQAGKFFQIEGRHGIYVWTPDAMEDHPEGTAVLTRYDSELGHASGEAFAVQTSKVVRLKGVKRKKPPVGGGTATGWGTGKPKPKRKPKGRKATGPKSRPKMPPPGKRRKLTIGDDLRERSEVYADSQAKEGTFRHKLENGHYPLLEVKDAHRSTNRKRYAVDVPKSDHGAMLGEFDRLISGAARKVAKSFRVPVKDGTGSPHPDFEELMQGARLGFILALQNYSGGRAFVPLAQDYAMTYANRAAQQTLQGGGATIPRRTMQLAHGLAAARHRARTSEDSEPSDKAIARAWTLKKRDIYTEDRRLGTYLDEDGEEVAQDKEELPLEDWKIVNADGEELGELQPGKLTMISRLKPLLDGERIMGSEWMHQHAEGMIPTETSAGMSVGTALHVRKEIDDILSDMTADNARTLSVLFGLSGDYTEGLEASGRDGAAMSNADLADVLGLSVEGDNPRTKARKGKQAREKAVRQFKVIAEEKRATARQHIDKWTRAKEGGSLRDPADFGPSHNDLVERFGNEERAALFRVGLRSGDSKRVAEVLERDKAGKATPAEMRDLRTAFYAQRNADRLHAFQTQTATIDVDPSEARDVSVGTDPDAVHLYTGDILRDALQALASGAVHVTSSQTTPGRSKVMDEDRFARFMGRAKKPTTQRQESDNG